MGFKLISVTIYINHIPVHRGEALYFMNCYISLHSSMCISVAQEVIIYQTFYYQC